MGPLEALVILIVVAIVAIPILLFVRVMQERRRRND